MPAAALAPRKTSARKRVSRYAAENAAALAAGKPLVRYAHPKTFAEFYEREPKLVTNWLRHRRCPPDLIADYAQDLLVFLMNPVTNKAGVTFEDHIAYYQPELMGSFGTRPAFLRHIFNMLTTEYPKAIRRLKRSLVRGDNIVSLGSTYLAQSGGGNPPTCGIPVMAPKEGEVVLTPLLSAQDALKFQNTDTPLDPQMVVDAFFRYLEDVAEPDVLAFARASMVHDTVVEIARVMDISRSRCRSLSEDMLYWAKKFRRPRC